MPITQLAEYAGESPYLGPPLLNGERLPYPSYPSGQVTVEWNAEHLVREYGTGRREIVRGARYRPTFSLSFDYLEAIVKVGVWEELKADTLYFAPYSVKEDGLDVPIPQAFEVLSPDTIPDSADLLLARYPFGLTLVGVETFAKADIPVVDIYDPNPPPAPTGDGVTPLTLYALTVEDDFPVYDGFTTFAP